MGIPGLTTYVNQYSDVHLQRYRLHDTYLIIDGNSLSCQLYTYDTKSNSCFGGDYDKYAYSVSNFFDELLKCNITPLVIIDGGLEEKKLRTVYSRTKDKIYLASNLKPSKTIRSILYPLLMKETFKNVLCRKGIKCAQSLFEADDDLASVAKILNSPVLSFDSDFYIFDVTYIPFNTLENGIVKITGNRCAKNCKMYKVEFFLQRFPTLNKSVMPLAATLLGNDYIKTKVFNHFFCTLKLPKTSKRKFNNQQRRIEALFRWLQDQTLDSAIAKVLSKLKPNKREEILQVMEMIINGYLIASPSMLQPLGFSQEQTYDLMRKILFKNRPYKFQQDVHNLKIQDEPRINEDDESGLSCNEEGDDNDDKFNVVKPEDKNNLCRIAPQWFLREFNDAQYPSYFMDMITRQLYICPVQIEDHVYPSCINISLKIIRVIFKLLSKGTSNSNTLNYVTRGKSTNVVKLKLNCDDELFDFVIPSLENLREIPLTIRREILNKTLGVSDELINKFPPEWKIYIATIKYWIDEAETQFATNCHLYSLLFAILYHVIDRQIGMHRSKDYFNTVFGQRLCLLQQTRPNNGSCCKTKLDETIFQSLNSVNQDDCVLAVPFFLKNFIIDQSCLINPKRFRLSTVHAFSLFQNSLRHSLHLNALLGYPYPHLNVAEFFNGTLIYNLYNNFKQRQDIDAYISTVLGQSPSLLQLFFSILTTVKCMFTKAIDNRTNAKKRKKNRNRCNKQSSIDDVNEHEIEDEVYYQDKNNRYSMLQNFS